MSDRLAIFLTNLRPAFVAHVAKKLFRIRRRMVRTLHGTFWVDPASYFGRSLIENGHYEEDMVDVIRHYLPPGGVFVDVGANEAYFSVVASRLQPEATVVAIEPQARLGSVIHENLSINQVADRVKVDHCALSDKAGEGEIFLTPDVNSGSSGLTRITAYPLRRQKVALKTLGDVLDSHGLDVIDVMKMDIEGHEWDAVFGAEELFQSRRVHCFALEIHPAVLAKRGLDGDKLIDFLMACGYRLLPGRQTVFLSEDLFPTRDHGVQ